MPAERAVVRRLADAQAMLRERSSRRCRRPSISAAERADLYVLAIQCGRELIADLAKWRSGVGPMPHALDARDRLLDECYRALEAIDAVVFYGLRYDACPRYRLLLSVRETLARHGLDADTLVGFDVGAGASYRRPDPGLWFDPLDD